MITKTKNPRLEICEAVIYCSDSEGDEVEANSNKEHETILLRMK